MSQKEAGERILELIDFLKISKNKFSTKVLGLSASTKIDNIIKGKNGISPEFANEICTAVPEISYEWLHKGSGDMLIKAPNKTIDFSEMDLEKLADVCVKKWEELKGVPVFKKQLLLDQTLSINEKFADIIRNKLKD